MENISTLERKLAAAKAQQDATANARYPSEVVIDLGGPEGNVYYVLGICNRLARQYGLSPDEIASYKHDTRLDGGLGYGQILDACQKWFGLVYIGRK